jgi:hypothetical protein
MRISVVARHALSSFILLVAAAGTLAAQERPPDESALVRQATEAEARGDLHIAEQLLRDALTATPSSLAALVAYERVLGTLNRRADVLPALQRLLADDASASLAHQMRVRTLSLLDEEQALAAAAESWFAAMPGAETAYREVARIWRERGEHARARQVLERGRTAIARPDALALELGDLYAETGDPARAVKEWSRAIGPEAQGLVLVQRRLSMYPAAGGRHILLFLDELARPPVTPQRQQAAVRIAIDAGLDDRAVALGRQAVASLRGRERQGFLMEMARRADGRGVSRAAYWAYSELLTQPPSGQQLPIRARVAELALATGDTANAARLFDGIEMELAEGSPERRLAAAVRIERTARAGLVDEASREYAAFTEAYTGAPENPMLAAALAEAYLERDEAEHAARFVAGVPGARAALVRARIFIQTGEIERARLSFLEAAPALAGIEATQAIALAALLARLSPPARELVGSAFTLATGGDAEEAAGMLHAQSAALPAADRAAVLDFAAGMADHAQAGRLAEQLRREIIAISPATRETPAAMLALARALGTRPESQDEARMLLEMVMLEHDRSALAPQARRELERLGARGSRTRQDLK